MLGRKRHNRHKRPQRDSEGSSMVIALQAGTGNSFFTPGVPLALTSFAHAWVLSYHGQSPSIPHRKTMQLCTLRRAVKTLPHTRSEPAEKREQLAREKNGSHD